MARPLRPHAPPAALHARSESDLLALLDHPHIVECRDVLRSPRQLVLVLEWLRCARSPCPTVPTGLGSRCARCLRFRLVLVLGWLRCALRARMEAAALIDRLHETLECAVQPGRLLPSAVPALPCSGGQVIDRLHELGLQYSEQQAAAIFVQARWPAARAIAGRGRAGGLRSVPRAGLCGGPSVCADGRPAAAVSLCVRRWPPRWRTCTSTASCTGAPAPGPAAPCRRCALLCTLQARSSIWPGALQPRRSSSHTWLAHCRDIKPENVMFASPPAEAAVAPLTAAQLQAGGGGGGARGAKGPPPSRMPLVKLVDLGMACIHDPARPQRGGWACLGGMAGGCPSGRGRRARADG